MKKKVPKNIPLPEWGKSDRKSNSKSWENFYLQEYENEVIPSENVEVLPKENNLDTQQIDNIERTVITDYKDTNTRITDIGVKVGSMESVQSVKVNKNASKKQRILDMAESGIAKDKKQIADLTDSSYSYTTQVLRDENKKEK